MLVRCCLSVFQDLITMLWLKSERLCWSGFSSVFQLFTTWRSTTKRSTGLESWIQPSSPHPPTTKKNLVSTHRNNNSSKLNAIRIRHEHHGGHIVLEQTYFGRHTLCVDSLPLSHPRPYGNLRLQIWIGQFPTPPFQNIEYLSWRATACWKPNRGEGVVM